MSFADSYNWKFCLNVVGTQMTQLQATQIKRITF
jgi:hypothetical protein